MIQHDLQQVYIFGLLQCVFSTICLFFAYSRKWGSPGFRKTTLVLYPISNEEKTCITFKVINEGNHRCAIISPSKVLYTVGLVFVNLTDLEVFLAKTASNQPLLKIR
jgi:hypothetical protein